MLCIEYWEWESIIAIAIALSVAESKQDTEVSDVTNILYRSHSALVTSIYKVALLDDVDEVTAHFQLFFCVKSDRANLLFVPLILFILFILFQQHCYIYEYILYIIWIESYSTFCNGNGPITSFKQYWKKNLRVITCVDHLLINSERFFLPYLCNRFNNDGCMLLAFDFNFFFYYLFPYRSLIACGAIQ